MEMTEFIDEYDEIIHADARNGHLTSLEAYLKHKPECINKLYRYEESTWTILLAACYFQQEAIVRMLVNQFQADIEAEGTILMKDGEDSEEIIEDVSPLWAAAAVNNLNIVKFLVQYGRANVNHVTKEHSTPLRAACYNGNLEMVRFLVQYGANPHQVKSNKCTNLMLAIFHQYTNLVTYFVDDIKCDLNQEDFEGKTALHGAVEWDLLSITKLLINRGALNLRDKSRNITPLMWAAIHGKIHYVAAFDGHCSDIEWIEARELLGSAFTGCIQDIENIDVAVEYLNLAFEVRVSKNIPKLLSKYTSKVFNHRRECQTLENLNQLVSFGSGDNFYIEGLLIQERLLGTSSEYYHKSLYEIGNTFMDRDQYDTCLRLWLYEFDLRRQRKIPLDKDYLRSSASLFDDLLVNNKIQMFISELCTMLTIMTDVLSSSSADGEIFDYNLVTLLHLLTVAARLLLDEDAENDQKPFREDGKILIKHIRSIVEKNYVTMESRSSLLHLSCNETTESIQSIFNYCYPCLPTVRLLFACGMDVNIIDIRKNTVLQILVRNTQLDSSMAIIDFLCNNTNVHIDFADSNGNPPIEYSDVLPVHTRTKIRRLQQKMGVTSLKCRCARLAKYNRLPYEECLSSSLVNFIFKH